MGSIWLHFWPAGEKMDFLFTGLGARIWGQLGGRLGNPKWSKKQEKPWYFKHLGSFWWAPLGLPLGRPWAGPEPRPATHFPPIRFSFPVSFSPGKWVNIMQDVTSDGDPDPGFHIMNEFKFIIFWTFIAYLDESILCGSRP